MWEGVIAMTKESERKPFIEMWSVSVEDIIPG